jgi:hypothetical protein
MRASICSDFALFVIDRLRLRASLRRHPGCRLVSKRELHRPLACCASLSCSGVEDEK